MLFMQKLGGINIIKKKITKDMSIGDVVKNYPKTIPIFMKHGLHCIGCHVAEWESIEQGAIGHGIDIKNLIEDLNNEIDVES